MQIPRDRGVLADQFGHGLRYPDEDETNSLKGFQVLGDFALFSYSFEFVDYDDQIVRTSGLGQGTSRILPMCSDDSISLCAAEASRSGNRR